MRRIDGIVAEMVAEMAGRVMKPNDEVVAAIIAYGWAREPRRREFRPAPAEKHRQFEMAL